jgi:hypothetical protein
LIIIADIDMPYGEKTLRNRGDYEMIYVIASIQIKEGRSGDTFGQRDQGDELLLHCFQICQIQKMSGCLLVLFKVK